MKWECNYLCGREDYHKKIPEQNNIEYYMINEGGYGIKGAAGAATISEYFKKKATHIYVVPQEQVR